jgi:hypothetical protein
MSTTTKSKTSKRTTVTLFALLITAMLIALIFAASHLFKSTAFPDPITDPGRYSEVRATLQQESCALAPLLPASIPTSATAITLVYEPKILQGAERFRLRFSLPETEYNALAVQIAAIPSVPSSDNMPGDPAIPPEFRIITLRYVPGTPDKAVGHGIAFRDATREIIYWYDAW